MATKRILDAIRKNAASSGLAYVPHVVRDAVDCGASLDEVHKELLAAEKSGKINLYPDDGFGRLSEMDKKLSLRGYGGTNLAYTKLKK